MDQHPSIICQNNRFFRSIFLLNLIKILRIVIENIINIQEQMNNVHINIETLRYSFKILEKFQRDSAVDLTLPCTYST